VQHRVEGGPVEHAQSLVQAGQARPARYRLGQAAVHLLVSVECLPPQRLVRPNRYGLVRNLEAKLVPPGERFRDGAGIHTQSGRQILLASAFGQLLDRDLALRNAQLQAQQLQHLLRSLPGALVAHRQHHYGLVLFTVAEGLEFAQLLKVVPDVLEVPLSGLRVPARSIVGDSAAIIDQEPFG